VYWFRANPQPSNMGIAIAIEYTCNAIAIEYSCITISIEYRYICDSRANIFSIYFLFFIHVLLLLLNIDIYVTRGQIYFPGTTRTSWGAAARRTRPLSTRRCVRANDSGANIFLASKYFF